MGFHHPDPLSSWSSQHSIVYRDLAHSFQHSFNKGSNPSAMLSDQFFGLLLLPFHLVDDQLIGLATLLQPAQRSLLLLGNRACSIYAESRRAITISSCDQLMEALALVYNSFLVLVDFSRNEIWPASSWSLPFFLTCLRPSPVNHLHLLPILNQVIVLVESSSVNISSSSSLSSLSSSSSSKLSSS